MTIDEQRLLNAQIALAERQARWELWKALAAIVASGALFGTLVIGLWHWGQAQQITAVVRIEQPLRIQTTP